MGYTIELHGDTVEDLLLLEHRLGVPVDVLVESLLRAALTELHAAPTEVSPLGTTAEDVALLGAVLKVVRLHVGAHARTVYRSVPRPFRDAARVRDALARLTARGLLRLNGRVYRIADSR